MVIVTLPGSESVAWHHRLMCERGRSRGFFRDEVPPNKRKSKDGGMTHEKSDGAYYSERGKATYMGKAPRLNHP